MHKTGLKHAALFCSLLCSACIEPFEGTKMELLLATGHVAGETIANAGTVPLGTHYEMYVLGAGRSSHLVDFEIRPIVDLTSPCYIEDERAFIPFDGRSAHGLHVTMWYEKLLAVYSADGTVTDDEAGALADAQIRVGGNGVLGTIQQLRDSIKAIVGTPYGPKVTTAEATALQAELDALAAAVPDASDISDAASATRRELCEAFFAAHPRVYVGADRLITLPLNGVFYGVVTGADPRTSLPLGGASLDIPSSFSKFDALTINWQFNDANDPRIIDYGGPKPIGHHYMAGAPEVLTRGVINVSMSNTAFATLRGEVALFTNLLDDDVHF